MRESFAAFKELVAKFPDSRYAPDATDRMLYLTNSLALYEVKVARYYYNRGAYVAAVNRAQAALVDVSADAGQRGRARRPGARATTSSGCRSCATTRSAS